jgi:hypothetical protein
MEAGMTEVHDHRPAAGAGRSEKKEEMALPVAIIISSIISSLMIGAALVGMENLSRYELIVPSTGTAWRIDRLTGEVVICRAAGRTQNSADLDTPAGSLCWVPTEQWLNR